MKKTTRATRFLEKKKIPFSLMAYDHKEKGAVFAAEATGFPLEKTIKTLVVHLENGQHVLVLMPGDQELSLKKIAGICNVKRAQMTDSKTAERISGYLVGGISPFGFRKNLQVYMETGLSDYDSVVINAGHRGLMLQMNPADILNTLKGRLFQNS